MDFDLELPRLRKAVMESKAERVLIQLPAGLRKDGRDIQKALESTGAEVMFWAGSCYGACDLPTGIENLRIGLVVQYGHSRWLP